MGSVQQDLDRGDIKAAVERGITFEVGWSSEEGSKDDERRMKKNGNYHRRCSVCKRERSSVNYPVAGPPGPVENPNQEVQVGENGKPVDVPLLAIKWLIILTFAYIIGQVLRAALKAVF